MKKLIPSLLLIFGTLLLLHCSLLAQDSKTNIFHVGKSLFLFPGNEIGWSSPFNLQFSRTIRNDDYYYKFGLDTYNKNLNNEEIGSLVTRNFLSIEGAFGRYLWKSGKSLLRMGGGPVIRIGGEKYLKDTITGGRIIDIRTYNKPGINMSVEYLYFPMRRWGIVAELGYQRFFHLTRAHTFLRLQIVHRFADPKAE